MKSFDELFASEYVLAHCHDKAPSQNYANAFEYGREMDFFDSENKLTQSGKLLASIISLDLENAYLESAIE